MMKKILEYFLKVLILCFSKTVLNGVLWWNIMINSFKDHERFFQIKWSYDSLKKMQIGVRFLYKLPGKWLPEADQAKRPVTILHQQ